MNYEDSVWNLCSILIQNGKTDKPNLKIAVFFYEDMETRKKWRETFVLSRKNALHNSLFHIIMALSEGISSGDVGKYG